MSGHGLINKLAAYRLMNIAHYASVLGANSALLP